MHRTNTEKRDRREEGERRKALRMFDIIAEVGLENWRGLTIDLTGATAGFRFWYLASLLLSPKVLFDPRI